MSWSQSKKKNKLTENTNNQKITNTALNTPYCNNHLKQNDSIDKSSESIKQCPYHFGIPSHICLSCRRSICLRCAITYCQQHTIHPQQQILPLLLVDLQKLTIEPRIEDIQLKLKQSQDEQDHMSKKILKMLNKIEQNFQHLKNMLDRKKQQILQYYHEEFANKYLSQYKKYDQELSDLLEWLQQAQQISNTCTSIEELDLFAKNVKSKSNKINLIASNYNLSPSQSFWSHEKNKNTDLKSSKLNLSKQKVKINKFWSEQKLQKVLFQIENISFKFTTSGGSSEKVYSHKKKRVTTESSEHPKISQFFPTGKAGGIIIKSGSNSRFNNTGRKIQ